jgi:hypothetical protein
MAVWMLIMDMAFTALQKMTKQFQIMQWLKFGHQKCPEHQSPPYLEIMNCHMNISSDLKDFKEGSFH